MPGLASASVGAGSMQVRIYGSESLLQSAIIPYVVKASLDPGPAEEDQVPMLVMLVQQAQQAIAGANAAASTANQVAQIANTAANLASEKAGLAQNAASSANDAATNATNSAELAQTAADNANSASESANSAAGTANNAADNANSAAESANNAAINANQVADEIQQKADSGAFNGKDGLNAPQIDDAQITTTNPWSSMQIVKTLCPPFSVSGPIVQCTPLANYPLDVKASWEPRQEGSGDPSPDNVRPIVGLDEVTVRRSGENLLDYDKIVLNAGAPFGLQAEKIGDYAIRIFGASNVGRTAAWPLVTDFDFAQQLSNCSVHVLPISGCEDIAECYIVNSRIHIRANLVLEKVYDMRFRLMITTGNAVPQEYVPFSGTTATLTLPETIYGGTVDAVTGEGSEEWSSVINLSSSSHLGALEDFANETTMLYYVADINYMQGAMLVRCSHLPTLAIVDSGNTNIGIYGNPFGAMVYIRLQKETASNLDEFKQWVDAQYAAGTPVQVAYKLATPTAFQATGNQPIPALPGTNTVYTDADTVTVSGLSDPVATIASLQARVSALESAQTNM